MDGYDWPLLAVFLLLVVSFMVILHVLRSVIDSLAGFGLKLRMARRTRLPDRRTESGNPAVAR